MMILDRKRESIEHAHFHDFPDQTHSGDLVVLNDTLVIPARMFARKAETGGRLELFFLEASTEPPGAWEVLIKASRRPHPGQWLDIEGESARIQILEELGKGKARVRLEGCTSVFDLLKRKGKTPLPPYIRREEDSTEDRERYQTVYARSPGAVAAPTAGLHFTPAVLEQLKQKEVLTKTITLHVGLGTFRPVDVENLEEHVMESERFEIPDATAQAWQKTREDGGRVIAVGSTSVRTLETSAQTNGRVQAGTGRSEMYIYPPYSFQAVDAILTNFHLPCSTLIMMMSAFAGREFLLEAYRKAVEENYRFYSYGDCMLIL